MSASISDDEKFVIESLTGELGGVWRPGEDPPDVYLMQGNSEVAIEISRLTQHVSDKSGVPVPRLSQDTGIVRFCDELDRELGSTIQPDKYIILTLHTPVDRLRQFKKILKDTLTDIANSEESEEISLDISGNLVKVNVVKGARSSGKKVVGIVANRNSIPNIKSNVDFILAHRIKDKTKKCSKITHRPLWLALFNDYWLADQDSYKQAMQQYTESHPFEKIYLISGNKEVHLIHET